MTLGGLVGEQWTLERMDLLARELCLESDTEFKRKRCSFNNSLNLSADYFVICNRYLNLCPGGTGYSWFYGYTSDMDIRQVPTSGTTCCVRC
jgi:hypothetical protein